MTMPTALNSGEPARIGAVNDTVTLVEGATFCLSDRHGDMVAGGSHGLFFCDARVLSRWEMRVDGQVADSLSVEFAEAFAVQFILRRTPRAGLADSTLLVVRKRPVADGVRETISLHNLDHESTVVSLELHADADFADLFSVKEGRAPLGGAEMTVLDGELMLLERTSGCTACPWRRRVIRSWCPGRCAGGSWWQRASAGPVPPPAPSAARSWAPGRERSRRSGARPR